MLHSLFWSAGTQSLYIQVMSVTRKANTPSRGSPVFVPSAVASGGYEESVGLGQSGTIWSARKGGWAFVFVLWESGSQCSKSRCGLFEELLKITLLLSWDRGQEGQKQWDSRTA